MKHLKHCIILLFIVLCLAGIPAFAQDATQEATQEATVEAQPISVVGEGTTINVNPSETPATPSGSDPMGTILQAVLAVCAIVVTASFAIEKLGNRAKAVNANPFETAALEKLGDGVPSVVVLQLTGAFDRMISAFENLNTTWKEATDKTPKASKPATYPASGGTPLSADYTSTPAQLTPLPKTANLSNPASLTDLHEPGVPSSGGAEEFRP